MLTFVISVEGGTVVNPYAAANVGDVVTFGRYDWYVIGKTDSTATLLMKDVMSTTSAYHSSYSNITWEGCALRSYLNDEFYNSNSFGNHI